MVLSKLLAIQLKAHNSLEYHYMLNIKICTHGELLKQSNLSLEGGDQYYIYILFMYVCVCHEENMKKYNFVTFIFLIHYTFYSVQNLLKPKPRACVFYQLLPTQWWVLVFSSWIYQLLKLFSFISSVSHFSDSEFKCSTFGDSQSHQAPIWLCSMYWFVAKGRAAA